MIEELDPRSCEESAVALILALRPHLGDHASVHRVLLGCADAGYRMVGIRDDSNVVVALAGFRLVVSLRNPRSLYIDDLVVDPISRRCGYATRLLSWLDDEALRLGCTALQLDTGHTRFDAHRRYLAAGYSITAHHLSKNVEVCDPS